MKHSDDCFIMEGPNITSVSMEGVAFETTDQTVKVLRC